MDSKILELEQQLEAALDYIEKISEKHEEERAQTILNAQKVRHVANKIAKERNEWKTEYEELEKLAESVLGRFQAYGAYPEIIALRDFLYSCHECDLGVPCELHSKSLPQEDKYEELYNAVLPVIRHIYTDHPGDEDAENHYFIALNKLRDLVEPKKHKPLESDEIRMNAGTVCDMEDGPCACGAWHKVK